MKSLKIIFFAALASVLVFGCDQSTPQTTKRILPYSLTSQTVAHLHWLGKKQLAGSTNATGLMRIWDLPESATLEKQTLDKLSTAPWRLLPHVATTNTAAAPLLRPLLDDCLQQESYLEIRAATNQPGEIAFAIQLPADRAALWQTNLAAVLESLTGLHADATEKGWSLKKHEAPNLIEFTRVGEWIVVGLGQDKNALFGDFVARVLRSQTPVPMGSSGVWLDTEVDLPSVIEAFKLGWKLQGELPKISVAINGGGPTVRTRGKLDFPTSLKLDLEPWQIPLSLIHPPLSSFTAIRGFKPWLASLKIWNDLQIGAPPNQFFCWAQYGSPQMTFSAAPLQDASNRVAQVSDLVMEKYGQWFTTNGSVNFAKSQTFNGLDWLGFAYLTPHLQSITTPEGEFAYGGLFPRPPSQRPHPAELINAILSQTNLVYYDWELTGSRNGQWLYIGQFIRLVSHKAQLPNAACVAWFRATESNLDACLTQVTKTGPNQLSFKRESGVGFSSFELQLLADWLESPEFPCGFYTLLTPAPPPFQGIKGRLRPANVNSPENR